ncbi:AI-2E family transporter [Ideonella sp. A 288]|uniref:AI-2E family transporter n=1 Tax=Ideonella sp. A 288 TaxID=1962181 RepID=UPI000B4BEFC7|nr:AI-2E family transporter [Ideonella sp. A 288]
MSASQPERPTDRDHRLLAWLMGVTAAALAWVLLPFFGAILWGVVIALLFAPVYHWLLGPLRGRRTLGALLTLLLVLLLVILPLVLVAASLASEATLVYQRLQSGEWNPAQYFRGLFDALPPSMAALLERVGLADFDALQRRLAAALAQGSQFIAGQALGLGQVTFEFMASLAITVYLSFFLIRDGDGLVRTLRRVVPLKAAQLQSLLDMFATVVRATVRGNLLVAVIQGALGGLAFWVLGVNAALLWAVLMAFLSLLPAIGAGLVWVPVAAYFFLTGAVWQAVALVAFGVLVIGLVDNLLRPVLVGKDTHMPDWLVMVTTLGGLSVMGPNGFIVGPAIAAMFIAVWHLHGQVQDGTTRA